MTIQETLDRWKSAQQGRAVWDNHFEDLARVMLPRRAGFNSSQQPGDQRTEEIYDGTPMQAARGLANALDGFLWPEGEQSFHIRAADDEIDNSGEAQDWLGEAEERMNEALDDPKARFRQGRGEANLDTVVFGTAVLFVGEANSLDQLLFQALHLKDCAVLFDDEGQPLGMFRHKMMTIRQAMQRFGKENLSSETNEKILQGDRMLDTKLSVLHAVTLRREGSPDALFAVDLPYGNTWIEVDAKHKISDGGFHEFPFVIPRWDTSSGEDYGRSPGMIALPDANTLQAMGETMLVAGQRAADPPLAVPNDGFFNAANTYPGGQFSYDVETAVQLRGNPFFTIDTGSNMPLTREMQGDVRDQVFRAFYRNVLNLPIDGPQMTATEIIERKQEFIREIGPVFGRLEVDYKAPLVERVFNLMLRAGAFPEIPEVLSGRDVTFEYESPIKQIREQIQAAAANQWALEQVQFAEFDPSALDIVNFDALGRFKHAAAGLPAEIVNPVEVVQARMEARQQAQQEAAELETLAQGAQIADTAAGAAGKLTEEAV